MRAIVGLSMLCWIGCSSTESATDSDRSSAAEGGDVGVDGVDARQPVDGGEPIVDRSQPDPIDAGTDTGDASADVQRKVMGPIYPMLADLGRDDMLERMSHDAISRFLSLIESDSALKHLLGVADNAGSDKPRISVHRLIELGEQHGCHFTLEELRARFDTPPRSLTAEERAAVSGGARAHPHDYARAYGFTVEFSPSGGGFNELSMDDTAGKEK